ncbi:Translation initiation factor IF-3 [Paenibacillus nuruki]|uniref:Translation initiation factor IF-3 n=2 Tax=Paenibacillus TaxID=44249 RepID=A0A1E3L4Z0_9BACL|nr:Translation initiation factor IF-3 [Paenibacillus nuruki]CAJ1316093.1 translation initiation factor IF-3 [Paenibacillus nuruki]
MTRFVLLWILADQGMRVTRPASLFNLYIYYSCTIIIWRWKVISKEHMINDEIRVKEVRLVGAEGEQIGITPTREALQMAIDLNMDLVNVAPQAKPPVCRIMDYGKFRYEQQKKEKEARKNQKIVDLKEVWFRANIEEHDYQTKLRNVVKFLKDGDKVKCSVRFRGREITHASIGQKILDRVKVEVEELCTVERQPKLEGRSMIMILAPKN